MATLNYYPKIRQILSASAVICCFAIIAACQSDSKKQESSTPSPEIVKRSQTDIYKLAEDYLKKSEIDSAFKYFEIAAENFRKNGKWERYVVTLIKLADIDRLKGNGDGARTLIKSAENMLAKNLPLNKDLLADIMHKQGVLYMDKGNFDSAIILINKSIDARIAANGPNDTLLAMSYNGLGNLFFFKGNYNSALENYNQAYELALKRKNPLDADLAMFIQNAGIIYAQKGDYEKAESAFSSSLEIIEKTKGPGDPGLAMPYLNMGRLLALANKDDEALLYYNRAEENLLKIVEPNHPDLGSLYLNKGQTYVHLADYEKALIFFKKALSIALENYGADHPVTLSANMNIGYIYEKKGEFDNALRYYEASIPKDENNQAVIKTYGNLASLYDAMNDPDQAEIYYSRAIKLADYLLPDNHPETGLLYTRYGYFQLTEARGDLGLSMFNNALEISTTHYGPSSREVSNNLTHIGNYYLIQNDHDLALGHYQKAIIAIVKNFENTSVLVNPEEKLLTPDHYLINALNGKADALFMKGKAEKPDIKALKLSLETYKLSTKVVHRLRSSYQNEESKLLISEHERKTYLNTVKVATMLYQVTGQTEFLEEAFNYSDKGKSAILLASLQDVEALQYGKIPSVIREKEKKIKLELGSYNRFIYEERQKPSPVADKIRLWESLIFNLEVSYDSLINVLETDYPEYYALKYTEPVLSIEQIRKNLEPGRALIEYALSDTVLYIFVLNQKIFDVITHPIDQTFLDNISLLRESTNSNDLMSAKKEDYLAYTNAAYSLYNDLLKPASEIIDEKKLIIIPDAEIGFISFDMLLSSPADASEMDFRKLQFLIFDYVISYSASAILQFSDIYKKEKKPTKNMLAMAPSYDNLTDLKEGGFIDETGNTVYLLPIPGVEEEIKGIKRAIPGKTLSGAKANEQSFKNLAGNYNILHFAMHTLINSEKPMLSKLVFYQDNDTIEDGMLNTYELFGMDLNARLAVLSACNTGTGKLLKGEGIMNLARGFIYAGVPGIVMTMWAVEDQASARIVKRFYHYLDRGMPKDEALHNAKLDLLEEKDMLRTHPYYWAAYVTIGDYSPMKFVKPMWLNIFFGIIALSSLSLLMLTMVRKKSRNKSL
ncbi:MAG: tetratricopeptide repeat protein [Lentimicrobium sp.]|nr:tetratricopeptide repeat protein [Lentimicrobium sp.]